MGRMIATAATLEIPSVKILLAKDSAPTRLKSLSEKGAIDLKANQSLALVTESAAPIAIAPPYIRIIPQLTFSSTSFQLTARARNKAAAAKIAIVAKPKRLLKNIQQITAIAKMIPIFFSFIDIRPNLRISSKRIW